MGCMNDQRILFDAPKLALTRIEAADALNISPATIDRLVKRGLLRPSRALRTPLFPIAEIERFLRETATEAAG
jgi:DNA-directed RNA polymerase specialized sigma24 family protein